MNLIIAPPSLVPTWLSSKNHKIVCGAVFHNPIRANNLLRLQDLHRSYKRYCSVNLDGDSGDEFLAEMLEEVYMKNKGCCTKSEKNLPLSRYRENDHEFPSKTDFLEPVMLGIHPDPPNWPERHSFICLSIEQKAKSFGLPLSLRMIKKKLQVRNSGESASCSLRKAFSSMVFIIVELQSYALQMMEVLWDEDMEPIVNKVQRDIRASFIWIFQHVFSRTPALMLYTIILLANFSVYSASQNIAIADETISGSMRAYDIADEAISVFDLSKSPNVVPEMLLGFSDQELRNETDIQLWDSMVEEATKMQGLVEVGLDRELMQRFVAPFSVEVEPDEAGDYFKLDFLYQVTLSKDPSNTLLLCNYAQFLQLVSQDYDRAEECFKRALEVEPQDGEALSQYAGFLWMVRKDLCGAEERFREAIAVEPGNPYYASRYANFLWISGGEESCSHINTSYYDNNGKTLSEF